MRAFAWAVLTVILFCSSAAGQSSFSNDRFGKISLFRDVEEPRYAVIFFPAYEGWKHESLAIAKAMSDLGALVIAPETSSYLRSINNTEEECSYLTGEIERLSQSAQKAAGLSRYLQPILVGFDTGAALAAAINAQHPQSFSGLLTINFCPSLPLKHELCPDNELRSALTPRKHTLEIRSLGKQLNSWINIRDKDDTRCLQSEIESFFNAEHTKTFEIEDPSHTFSFETYWFPKFRHAFLHLASAAVKAAKEESVSELPLVEVPVSGTARDFFVILLSGDGGWATIDKEIGTYLSERGVPVVGFDSLKFFWKEKSASEVAQALEAAYGHYSQQWKKEKLVLIGYSMGADVLPFAVNKLPPQVAKNIIFVSLLSPGLRTDFEVNIGDWLGISAAEPPFELLPEVNKFSGFKLQCVYGKDEAEESLCPVLPKGKAEIIAMEGAHHFDGDYEDVAEAVLKSLSSIAPKPAPSATPS